MWILYAITSGFCAALLAVIVKAGLSKISSYIITCCFSVGMSLVLILYGFFSGKLSLALLAAIPVKEWLYLTSIGLISAIAFIAYFSAIQAGPICAVMAIDRAGIIFAVFLAFFFLQEPLTVQSLAGAALIILGTWFLSC